MSSRTSGLMSLIAAAAVVLTVAACGSSSKDGASAGTQQGASGAGSALRPPGRIADRGTLVFADNAPFPPMVNLGPDNRSLVGFEPDLGAALAEKLGVKAKFVNIPSFDGIIPAVLSGRADVGMAYFEDRVDRRDKFAILDYLQGSPVYILRDGNPLGVTEPDDLCGRRIAIQKGTQQQVDLYDDLAAGCASASKAKPELLQLPKESDAALAVRSGRADAVLTDDLAGAATVKGSKGTLEMGPPTGKPVLHGMLIAKGDTELRDAVQQALRAVVADGTYARLIEKWDIRYASYTKATVNGG